VHVRTVLPARGRTLALAIREVLRALAASDAILIRSGAAPRLKPLYSSGVCFRPEPNEGRFEEWADPWTVAARGWGDCDDLVRYRVAELLAAGERASVQCMWVGRRMHVRVRRASMRIEDPALMLSPKEKFPWQPRSFRSWPLA